VVFYTAFLQIVGAPYPMLLAGIAAILEVIPVVGPLTASCVDPVVAAFTDSQDTYAGDRPGV